MKKLLAFLALALTFPAFGGIITNFYTFTDFNLNPQSVRRVTQTPIQPFADYNGAILSPNPIAFASSGAGTVYFTNTIAGYAYRVQIDTPFGSTVRTCGYPSYLIGTVNGRDWLGNFGPGSVGGIPGLTFYFLYPPPTNFISPQSLVITNGAPGPTPGFVAAVDATGSNWFFESIAGGSAVWPVAGTNSLLTTNANAVTINGQTDTNVVNILAAAKALTATNQLKADLTWIFQWGSSALTNLSNGNGSALWSVWGDWNHETNIPPQVVQLGTNYIGSSVTNAIGQIIANALQGFIAGAGTIATTNNNVITHNLASPLQLAATNFVSDSGLTNSRGMHLAKFVPGLYAISGITIVTNADGTLNVTVSGGASYYGPTFTNLIFWDTASGIYFTNVDGSYSLWHDGTWQNFGGTGLSTVTNLDVFNTLAAQNAYITNEQFTIAQAWAGPTNNLPVTNELQTYTTSSDMWISNYAGTISAAIPSQITLIISNSVATNCALRFPLTANNISSVLAPASSDTIVTFWIGGATNVFSETQTNIPWASNVLASGIVGTIGIGNLSGPLQLLSTNYIGPADTNALGQFTANALQGWIAGQGLTGSTNNNVVTANLVAPLQLLSTNYIGSQTNALGQVIANAHQGFIAGAGMTATTNNNVVTDNLAGPLQLESTNYVGAQTNSGGYFISNSIFGIISGQGLTFTTNNGVVTENLVGPLQLLSTNYIGAQTNSGGLFISNAVFGIIQSGATTNNGVVTLAAGGGGTGIQTNGGTGINNLLTNLTMYGPTVLSNGNFTISNPAPSAVAALLVTNWGITSAEFDGNTNTGMEVELKNYNAGGNARGLFVTEADSGDSGSFNVSLFANSSGFTNFQLGGWTNDQGIVFSGGSNNVNAILWLNNTNINGNSNHLFVAIGNPTNFVVDIQTNQFVVNGANGGGSTFNNWLLSTGTTTNNGNVQNQANQTTVGSNYSGTMLNAGAGTNNGAFSIGGPIFVTNGGATLGIITNNSTRAVQTNALTWGTIQATNEFTFWAFATNVTVAGWQNIDQSHMYHGYVAFSNGAAGNITVTWPSGTRLLQGFTTNQPLNTCTVTNGKVAIADWWIWSHLGQSLTNVEWKTQSN